MPLYEVELHGDGATEVRLSGEPLDVGKTVTIGSRAWYVYYRKTPPNGPAAGRYVCVAIEDDPYQSLEATRPERAGDHPGRLAQPNRRKEHDV